MAAAGNNGSGLGVYPVDPYQPKTREQIRQEAYQIWDSIPTPIWDEFLAGPQTELRYHEYRQQLKERYGDCKNFDYIVSSTFPHVEGIMPTWSGYGDVWKQGIRIAEKSCQLAPRLEQLLQETFPPEKRKKLQLETAYSLQHHDPAKRGHILGWEIWNPQDLEQLLITAEDQKIAKKALLNKEQARHYKKVPMGNLLKLNAPPPEPNLLGFGPTQAGLNARARELQGLFGPAGAGGGGAVRHRKRKQRKTQKRKNRHNRTRKN